jgi:subtilisin family serine protease
MGFRQPRDLDAIAREYGLSHVSFDRDLLAAEISASPTNLQHLAASVTSDKRLRYVEPVVEETFMHRRNDPLTYTIDAATGVPYEWWFASIGLDRALNLSVGSPSIVVGVIDSGLSPGPDLQGKIAATYYDTSLTNNALDSVGHGTFVSTIIAAKNDDGSGLAGACGACRIVMVKATPDGSDSISSFASASAIRFVADQGIRVLNLSYAGPCTQVEFDALRYAIEQKGVLVVAASGNEDAGAVDCPAAALQPNNGAPSAGLAVGASDYNGNRASFSNFGLNLSLVAPGTYDSTNCTPRGIFSALPASNLFGCYQFNDPVTGGHYGYANGTSFSSPIVAGTAALMLAARPDLNYSQAAAILKQSPSQGQWTVDRGWGVLNAARALEIATGRSSADPPTGGTGPPVADSQQPVARALAGTYRPGAVTHLSFRLRDNSGQARVIDMIYNAKSQKLGQVRSGFTQGATGAVFYLTWRAPRSATGTLEHCVVAWDRAGNSSNESCARLRRKP